MSEARWRDEAACTDTPVAVFFPGPRESVLPAQRICAECPVWRQCATDSTVGKRVRFASIEGAWAGIGGSARRALIVALRDVDHPPERDCDDPDCDWCSKLRAHRVRLDVVAGKRDRSEIIRVQSFGPNATHGNRVTHARGCRCAPCKFSTSAAARRLKLAGIDPIDWWEWQFAPHAGATSTAEWVDLDETHAAAILQRAKVAALQFLAENLQMTG